MMSAQELWSAYCVLTDERRAVLEAALDFASLAENVHQKLAHKEQFLRNWEARLLATSRHRDGVDDEPTQPETPRAKYLRREDKP